MDERDANIDLLFRNGLKDFEVLPPSEAWDKISPAIRDQQRPYLILRVAAVIAVLMTLGILTSRFNDEVSSRRATPGIADILTTTDSQPLSRQDNILAEAVAPQSFAPATEIPNSRPEIIDAVTKSSGPSENYSLDIPSGGISGIVNEKGRVKLIETPSPGADKLTADNYSVLFTPEIKPAARRERWTIAALVSPTYLSGFQSSSSEESRQLVSAEQPLISYAGGVALSYKVNKRLSVQSGIYYSSYGNELAGINSFSGLQEYNQSKGERNFDVKTTNGTVYTNNADVYLIDNLSDNRTMAYFDKSSFDPTKANLQYLDNSLIQNLSYIELPLILRYKFVDRAIDFNIIGGLSSNLLVSNSVYTTLDGGKYEVGRTEGVNNIIFSSSLGMGMEYNLSKKLSLNLEPTFRYFLNPLNTIPDARIHPYSFGIFSGISYRF